MGASGETEHFSPVGDDVVLMHGQVWRVREKGMVRIEELSEPGGSPLGATNWRRGYVGAYGLATFADDAMGSDLSVVQVRCLVYCEEDGTLRPTHDILRTSTGVLVEGKDTYTLITKRTRYVFRRVDESCEDQIGALIAEQ